MDTLRKLLGIIIEQEMKLQAALARIKELERAGEAKDPNASAR